MTGNAAYVLSKKYTNDSLIGIGAIKGAPCKVKSVTKTDGRSIITLEWEDNLGETHETEVYVNDGVSIWISGRQYAINDIVIKDNALYICKVANSDANFDNNKWTIAIGGGTNDYNALINKPTLNGNEIVGNQTTDDLGLADGDSIGYDENGKLSIGIISSSDINDLFP